MEPDKVHFRHIMLYHFREGLTAAETRRKICAVYGDNALQDRVVRKWFARFRLGNFEVEDEPRSGRPRVMEDDEVITLIKSNPLLTIEEIQAVTQVSFGTVWNRLHGAGFVNKKNQWLPHELNESQLQKRVDICDVLLRKYSEDPFLRRMITGDEKWILYKNVAQKKCWVERGRQPETIAKPEIHQKKVMLCCWWDRKGLVHYELLREGCTVSADVYCEQLENLRDAVKLKRPELINRKGVVFQHDNARPHTSVKSRKKLAEFSWDVLPHPPYSPDLAPSDYHLFRSLQNSLRDATFDSFEGIKNHLDRFFESKPTTFWEEGIDSLPRRWAKVMDNDGQYIIE